MTWRLEPHAQLRLVESILPKEEETLILVAKAKLATAVRAGGEAVEVRGQEGYFLLTSFRVGFIRESQGVEVEAGAGGEETPAPKRRRVLVNTPLVYLPELQEHHEAYTSWKNHMNLLLETPSGVQEVVYVKATGEVLDFQRTSHDFFKRCFSGPFDFEALAQTGVKHLTLQEQEIYQLVGERIGRQMTVVPESLLRSYRKAAQKEFRELIQFLVTKGQGGYYDPVARTLSLRGGHVHISLEWQASSSNAALQQKIQLLLDEWRAEEEAKREKLGYRFEITGF